jgi:hypothetical protein
LVWSDPDVRKLAKAFIPAADECNVMLWQRSPDEKALFTRIGEQGHYGKPQQGVYAAAPGGTLLGSSNERDAKKIAQMLRSALEKWEQLPRAERLLAQDPSQVAVPKTPYPADGLVLQLFSRDGSVQKEWWGGASWNQDYAWFTNEEMLSLVPKPGARLRMPEKLARRLVRFHLVDNVRGETEGFAETDVKKAEIDFIARGTTGASLVLEIQGTSKADTGKNGFEAKIVGRALWDSKKNRFEAFELVAVGNRWGATTYNGREQDPGPAPMGIAFRLAPTAEGADRVPPNVFRLKGAEYFK